MRKRLFAIVFAALILAPGLVQAQDIRKLPVIAMNFAFNPSIIEAEPCEPLQVTLVNRGTTVHAITFELPQGPVTSGIVVPGETRTITLTAPQEPGEYAYYCPVGNHRGKGMTGTLIVKKRQ